MFDGSLVDIFFEIFVFAIVIGVLVRLCKTIVFDAVTQQMQDRQDELDKLQNQVQGLVEQEKRVERDIDEQTVLCNTLKQNISRWRVLIDQQHAQEHDDWEVQQKQIIERLEYRQQKLAEHRLEQQILPESIARARAKLEQRFANEKEGQDFIALLVDRVEGS